MRTAQEPIRIPTPWAPAPMELYRWQDAAGELRRFRYLVDMLAVGGRKSLHTRCTLAPAAPMSPRLHALSLPGKVGVYVSADGSSVVRHYTSREHADLPPLIAALEVCQWVLDQREIPASHPRDPGPRYTAARLDVERTRVKLDKAVRERHSPRRVDALRQRLEALERRAARNLEAYRLWEAERTRGEVQCALAGLISELNRTPLDRFPEIVGAARDSIERSRLEATGLRVRADASQ